MMNKFTGGNSAPKEDELIKFITKIGEIIEQHYIDEKKGTKIKHEIGEFLKSPIWERYRDGSDMFSLRRHINSIIWSISDDGHFMIAGPAATHSRSHIARFTPNYIKIDRFEQMINTQVREDYKKALKDMKSPYIIDLRDCPGGSPETAYYLLSHFFPVGTYLFDLETRQKSTKLVAKSEFPFYVDGPKVGQFKGEVRVIINGATASAAELVAYVLKKTKRGKIYGVKSAGHAHIVYNLDIGPFIAKVPFARTKISGETWEAQGVVPDYDSTSTEYVDLLYNDVAFNYLN